MRKFDSLSKIRFYALLSFGLICLGLAILRIPTVWAFKSSLTPINGTVRAANLYISTIVDKKGYQRQVSELVFFLKESDKVFYLAEDIGDNHTNGEYNKILSGLNRSKSVTVWIKKSESNNRKPKVFQIDKDNEYTLLEFQKVKAEEGPMTAFLLIMGISSIVLVVWVRYPEKLKKVFNDL